MPLFAHSWLLVGRVAPPHTLLTSCARSRVHSQGELTGFDQTINVILSASVERVYSLDEPVEEVPLGLYIVRGDNIVSDPVLGSLVLAAHSRADQPTQLLTID